MAARCDAADNLRVGSEIIARRHLTALHTCVGTFLIFVATVKKPNPQRRNKSKHAAH
jgi:hypothetical protein